MVDKTSKIKISISDLITANPNLEKVTSPWVNALKNVRVRIDGQRAEVDEVEVDAGGTPTSITVIGPPIPAGEHRRWLIVVAGQDDQIIAILNYENGKFALPDNEIPKGELPRVAADFVAQLIKKTAENEKGDLSQVLTDFAHSFAAVSRNDQKKRGKQTSTEPDQSPKDKPLQGAPGR